MFNYEMTEILGDTDMKENVEIYSRNNSNF